jgi:hypothetical protein
MNPATIDPQALPSVPLLGCNQLQRWLGHKLRIPDPNPGRTKAGFQ